MDYLENDLLEDLENGVEDIAMEDDDFENETWGEDDDDFESEDWGEDDDDDDGEAAEFLWGRRKKRGRRRRPRAVKKLKRGRRVKTPTGRNLRVQLKKLAAQLKGVDATGKANAVRLRKSIKGNSTDIAKVRNSNILQNKKLNKINKAVENLNNQRMWTMLMPPSIKSFDKVDDKGTVTEAVSVKNVKSDMSNSLMMMMMSGGMNLGSGKSGGMDPMMMIMMMQSMNGDSDGGLFGGDNGMLMMMLMMNKK